MAKKTGSKMEIKFGELSESQIILEEKIKEAKRNNDDYSLKKYSHHLKKIELKLAI